MNWLNLKSLENSVDMTSRQLKRLLIMVLIMTGLTLVAGAIAQSSRLPSVAQSAPTISRQRFRIEDVVAQVYAQVPSLPHENQYVSVATGKVDPDNTLVERLIRYHLYVRSRPPLLRLDWQLTLGDYLGINQIMNETTYPGYETLKTSPLEGDRNAIDRLSLSQRRALLAALVSAFNPESQSPTERSQSPTQPTSSDAPAKVETRPNLLRPLPPGGAEQLRLP
jgi:hypothetical protein